MTVTAVPITSRFSLDRWIVGGALFFLTGVSWTYLIWDASRMDCCSLPSTAAWHASEIGMLVVMWTIMMIAMMVPTVAPMVLLFAAIQRQRRELQRPYVPAGLFLLGYLLVWTGFSILATAAQWGLHATALLSPMMISTSPIFGGVVLIATGVFQFSETKRACLRQCRSPLDFLLTEWREGPRGAVVMGLRHGVFCTGCCWLIMLLLFVVGVMNLMWVAALTALVLAEKVLPRGQLLARVAGVAMIAWGIWMLAHW
jgi:predicted metal-binding membrane protein